MAVPDFHFRVIIYAIQFALAAGLILLSGCSAGEVLREDENNEPAESEATSENYYQSYTGSDLLREQLKVSFDSIKRIQNNVVYRTYLLDPDSPHTQATLKNIDLEAVSVRSVIDNHSTAGTSIVMTDDRNRSSLLTAAHTVTFPDTLWHFAPVESDDEERLEAVSVMESVTHFVHGDERIVPFDLVVKDDNRDLAVLKREWERGEYSSLEVLSVPAGNADELDWTDLVYAVGYPKGVQMITRGMLSPFPYSSRRSFVMDASFNRGFSGGAVFAVKNDGSGLDWVGIVSFASADREHFLQPIEEQEQEFDPELEYTGSASVQSALRINYGITFAIDINEIRNFFSENEEQIRQAGLSIPGLD